ncbi:MAG TPA: helix-turn-helix transcriptional regulator [Microbacterium sp.]|nr:helix-turn-helix transcriptional regulator [Microbacterium sp.]
MIQPRTPRRQELGEFLAARRRSASRSELGLPPHARRGDAGLSREDVATLSGVSASWYTWLEQGRDINVSHQVLNAVSRVLRLSDDEAAYVAGLAEPGAGPVTPREDAPGHLQRLVDALDFPAFIVTTDWAIVGWNSAYEWLYPRIASLDPRDRNLLWLVYTDPQLREMLPDWEQDSRRFLAEFRAEAGVRLAGPRHSAVVERLRASNADFERHWSELGVSRFSSRRRTFRHRDEGLIEFEHHRLVPSDATDLHVVMYVSTPPHR